MTIFEAVKSTITPRQAAEQYGFTVSRNGMTCCPFHDDRHPSMKLNEETFYCFGCGEKGDVIDFTARLYGITNLEAAQKLASDFGITAGKPSVLAKLNRYKTQAEEEQQCFRVLSDYLHISKTGRSDMRRCHRRMSLIPVSPKPVTWKPALNTSWSFSPSAVQRKRRRS